MKEHELCTVAGAAALLLCAGAATADFSHISWELVHSGPPPVPAAPGTYTHGDGASYDVYRFYANFEPGSPANVTAIGVAADGTPLVVNNILSDGSPGSGFNNYSFHGNIAMANTDAFWGLNSAGQWQADTYFTIGNLPGYTPVIDPKTGDAFIFGLTPGFNPPLSGTMINVTAGAWITIPDSGYGHPDENDRVLLAQITVLTGEHLEGVFNLTLNSQSTGPQMPNLAFSTLVGDDPTGACCFDDFTCEEGLTESECDAAGGSYAGDDSTCDDCPEPPDPTGACCHGDFTCTEGLTEAECVGDWFEDATCDVCPLPPDPTGACCFDDFTCAEDLTAAECAMAGGDYAGDDTTCAACPEPPPTGACCYDDFTCDEDLTAKECADNSGAWQGAGSTCADCPAPPPTGACCFDDFTCAENLTSKACTDAGGTWAGAGTTCDDCPDEPDPVGACCYDDFTCDEGLTASQCSANRGAWQGPGSTCADCPAPPPTGACCYDDFTCDEGLTAKECTDGGGSWAGAGSTCDDCPDEPDPTGACCFDDFTCTPNLTAADCAAAGGSYAGDGSTCDDCPEPPDPTGACCFDDFTCTPDLTAAECAAEGGSYAGDGSTCDDCPAEPDPTGACCFDDFTCTPDLTAAECAAEGGNYAGDGSTCDDCPEPPATGACCFDDFTCTPDLTAAECAVEGGSYAGDGTTCDACPTEPPPVCGPGAGDCCAANGTPGCENVECCEAICAADSFCCDISWDSICADAAQKKCAVCQVGEEGCSHGFWKNHAGKGPGNQPNLWGSYSPDDVFDAVFGTNVFGNATLHQVISSPSGGSNAVHSSPHYVNLGKQAVAALLNADSVHYPYTVQEVIDMVAAAFADGVNAIKALHGDLAAANNLGCPDFAAPDVNSDGSVDIQDLIKVLTDWGKTSPAADINGDGVVDTRDLHLLYAAWGSSNPAADLTGNGTVGVADLYALMAAWGNTGPAADVNRDGLVNIIDLLEIISNWGPAPAEWQP